MLAITLFVLSVVGSAYGFSFSRSQNTNNVFTTVGNNGMSSTTLKMGVSLADLPYDYTALQPMIGEQTLKIHHGKHHAKYVTTTNEMIKGTDMEGDDVITILRKAHASNNQGLFNNAAQSFNHEFYWQSMKPNGGGLPSGKLLELINKDFGSYDNFRKEFTTAALTAFGSGWAWLSMTPSGLKVTKTIGAGTPLTDADFVPLLTCDVWEHAYYLDYQNLRASYVDTFMDKLVNWDAVAARIPK